MLESTFPGIDMSCTSSNIESLECKGAKRVQIITVHPLIRKSDSKGKIIHIFFLHQSRIYGEYMGIYGKIWKFNVKHK